MLDVARSDQCALTQRVGCKAPLHYVCGDAVDHTGQLRFDQRELVFNFTLRGTELHSVYEQLVKHFPIGRVRLMRRWPEQGWGFHRDPGPRVHVAIETQPEAYVLFAFGEEFTRFHVPADGSAWWIDTTREHGVLVGPNGGPRIHLVAEIITPECLPAREP